MNTNKRCLKSKAKKRTGEENPPVRYKFRAECQPDIDALFELLPPENVLWWQVSPAFGAQFPDRACEIELSGMMLNDLKKVIEKIPDGHVMLETVAKLKDYTGER